MKVEGSPIKELSSIRINIKFTVHPEAASHESSTLHHHKINSCHWHDKSLGKCTVKGHRHLTCYIMNMSVLLDLLLPEFARRAFCQEARRVFVEDRASVRYRLYLPPRWLWDCYISENITR